MWSVCFLFGDRFWQLMFSLKIKHFFKVLDVTYGQAVVLFIFFSYLSLYLILCSSYWHFLFFPTGTGNIVVIMVSYPKGREILDLVQKGIAVKMTIGVGTRHVQEFISGQSVVFVAIAFITMMIISLAWLIFYYIQRFLYTGSQFGSQVIMGNSF